MTPTWIAFLALLTIVAIVFLPRRRARNDGDGTWSGSGTDGGASSPGDAECGPGDSGSCDGGGSDGGGGGD
jgi:hypothetical protein